MRSMAPRAAPPRAGASPGVTRPRVGRGTDHHRNPDRPVSRPSLRASRSPPRPRPRLRAIASSSSPASSVDAQQAAFARWRDERGINAPNVEVAYFGDVDDDVMRHRGVRASRDLAAGDVLVELPREACLILMDDAELPFPDFCTNELWSVLTERNKWAVKVALNLLRETTRQDSDAPKFRPYLDQLPKEFDLLSEWSDAELKELQYDAVVRAAEGQRKEDEEAFALLAKHSPGTLELVDRDRLTWALNMVRSRVFSGRLSDAAKTKKALLPKAMAAGTAFAAFLTSQTQEGRWLAVFAMLALVVFDKEPEPGEEGGAKLAYVLMPLVDAFNHKTLPSKTEFEFSSEAFRLRAPEKVARGEEVMISYGLLGNDELVTRYGFADAENASDVYAYQGLLAWLRANHAPMRKAAGEDPERASRVRDARLESFANTGVFDADGEADENLAWALRALLATREEFERAGGVSGFKLGGGEPERRANAALADACEARLGEMKTSAEEDEATLRSGKVTGRMRVAVEYRLRKKKILRRAVERYGGGGGP